MALSRFRTLLSTLRLSRAPAAAVSCGGSSSPVLEAGDFGSQLRNQLSARELQASKLQSSMGCVGQDVYVKSALTAAITKNLGNCGNYQRLLPVSSLRGQHLYPFAASGTLSTAGNRGAGAQQVRTIMVEVNRNDLDRAIRRWRRKCKEENLRALKDREYYIKPSEKRVLALKERDHRVARKAFKQKLNWIMSRRQRGF